MEIQYHLGPSNDWSMQFASPSFDNAEQYIVNRDAVRLLSFDCPEQQMFVVYSGSTSTPATDSSVTVTHPITEALVRVFRGVVDGNNGELNGNKPAGLDDIPARLGGHVDWGAECYVVGGQLWSSLVRLHPLPNANHRSSLGLVLLYLEVNNINVDVSELDTPQLNKAIRESKRLLTVRRRVTPFSLLEEAGCTGVTRKNGVSIQFSDYDLDVSDPYGYYDERHEEHAVSFIRSLLSDQERSITGKGFSSFRDSLS